jgi:hypothetical protein
MSRERLPNRRAAERFELQASGLRFTRSVGRFGDGRLAEIFLTNHKAGSHADTAVRAGDLKQPPRVRRQALGRSPDCRQEKGRPT